MGQAHRRHSAQDKVALRLFDFWASWLAEDMGCIGGFVNDLGKKRGKELAVEVRGGKGEEPRV